MKEAATLADGGPSVREWTVHCPDCGGSLSVVGDRAVACPHCGATVQPHGMRTAAHRPPRGKRIPQIDSLLGTRLGRFELIRLIGRGGMGRVYEARPVRGAKPKRVALKVLSEDLASDPAFVRRFRREARVLEKLSHPHLVQILEQGEQDGRLWFAMEYVRGESLRRRMEAGPIPAKECARIASEVASALAYAHAQGVIHRDLKPENVLLDEKGTVHLVDFGLSRMIALGVGEASTRLTRTDVIMGTYEYMSPEQRRGDRELDARADVFALGVILYEMLTASLPLGRFTPPSETNRKIPKGFDAVVNRALATDRKDRHPNAEAFQAAVQAAASKAPVPDAPVPQPIPGEDAEWLQRHVDITSAIDRVVAVLAILIGFGVPVLKQIVGMPWLHDVVSGLGLVLVIFGVLLWRQGKRLARMKPGAREAQVTASVFMLFFPPFVTLAGIYGLWVFTSRRAHRAFPAGRALRHGRRHTVVREHVVTVEPVVRPRSAPLPLRVFHFLAILWSLYAYFIAFELFGLDPVSRAHLLSDEPETMRNITIIAALFALLLVFRFLFVRKRRGLGLAVVAFLFLATAAGLLIGAVEDVRPRRASWIFGTTNRSVPRTVLSEFPAPPLLERSK